MKNNPHAITSINSNERLCGAKTRNGTMCKAFAISGKNRCRMHGGAFGSGAPIGNKNALKYGYYTCEAIADRKSCRRELKKLIRLITRAEKVLLQSALE